MKIAKKLIPIGVVLLFVAIAFVPSASAANPGAKGDEKTLTIWLPGITEDDFTTQITVSGEQLADLTEAMDNFLDYAELAMEDNEINIGEWTEFKTLTNDMITIIKEIIGEEFPDVDTDELVEEIASAFIGPPQVWALRSPIFSIGRGYTWIPFYNWQINGNRTFGKLMCFKITIYTCSFSENRSFFTTVYTEHFMALFALVFLDEINTIYYKC